MESKQNVLIIIAVIVIILGGYWLFQYKEAGAPEIETNTATTTGENTSVETGGTAILSVETDKESYVVGDTVLLTFYANTEVPASGADVTFSFDDSALALATGLAKENFSQQVAQLAQVNQAQKTQGAPMVQYASSTKMGNQIKYTFSSLALPGQGMTGKTKLGTVALRAKKAGDSPIAISFENVGVSTDSNIAYDGRDILKTVEGTTVHVQAKP